MLTQAYVEVMRNYNRNKSEYVYSTGPCLLSIRMSKRNSNIGTIKLALSLRSIMFKQVIFVAEEY